MTIQEAISLVEKMKDHEDLQSCEAGGFDMPESESYHDQRRRALKLAEMALRAFPLMLKALEAVETRVRKAACGPFRNADAETLIRRVEALTVESGLLLELVAALRAAREAMKP